MSKEKTLIKNTIIYAIGNFASKFLNIILLPLYTYYFSVNDYGFYDIITTTVSLLVPIVTLQITDGLFRYLIDNDNKCEQSKIITTSFIILIFNIVIFNFIYFIFIQMNPIRYSILINLQINFFIFTSFILQIARGLKRNAVYSFSGIIATIITLIMNIILIVFFNFTINALLISSILANLIQMIFIEYKVKSLSYIKISKYNKRLKSQLILYSIPMIPNVVNWWVMNASDRYMIKKYIGVEGNGIYAIANKFPSILMMVNSIFYLAWQESAISEFKSKDRDSFYTNMFNNFMKLEFTTVICLLAFTPFLMEFLINNKFNDAYKYIPLLYFGTVFTAFSSFYGTGYQSSKETKGAFYTSIEGAVINIIINIIFIPIIGIQAASLSTFLAFLAMWITRVVQTKKYFNIKIEIKSMVSLILLSIIYTILYYIKNKLIILLSMITSLIIFIYFNKRLLVKGIKLIKCKLTINSISRL